MLSIKKEHMQSLYVILFLFVLIFAPPILPKIHILVGLFSVMMLVLMYKRTDSGVLIHKDILKWLLGVGCFFVLTFASTLINTLFYQDLVQMQHYFSLYNRYITVILVVLTSCLYLQVIFKKYGYNRWHLLRYVIYTALIEATLSYMALFIPSVKDLFISIMEKNTGSVLYNNTWYITVRSYGFAGSLLDFFGWGMGIIAGISLIYGILRKRRYILYSSYILVAAVLNSRTVIVIYLIAVVIIYIYVLLKKDFLTKVKWILLTFLLAFAVKKLFDMLLVYNSTTYYWINDGLESLKELLISGQASGDFGATLFQASWWELPSELLRLFIGTGHSRYRAKGYMHTDVGYVNDIWFAGILGTTIFYLNMVRLFYRNYKNSKSVIWKLIFIFIGVSMILFNVKSCAFGYNVGCGVMFTLLFLVLDME